MKLFPFPRLIVLATLACGALTTPQFALAQPEAPAGTNAPREKKGKKPKAEQRPRGKMMRPRMVEATETAMGKPLTPALKEQLTQSMQARDAAVKAANEAYYASFAQATGLTAEQAKEIDRPGRNGTKGRNGGNAEGKKNADTMIDNE